MVLLAVGRGEPSNPLWFVDRSTPSTPCGQSIVPDIPSCDIERRVDGAVVVRVHSRVVNGRALPDAVFSFRAGDPQYTFWEQQLQRRDLLPPTQLPMTLPMLEPT